MQSPKTTLLVLLFLVVNSVCLCKGCQGTEIVIPTSNLGVWVKINCCSWLFYGPKIWLLKTPTFTIWAFSIQTIKCLGYIDGIQADFLSWNCASLMITPACFLNLETSCFPQRILYCLSLGKKCLCATIMKFIELKNSPEMGLPVYTQFSLGTKKKTTLTFESCKKVQT